MAVKQFVFDISGSLLSEQEKREDQRLSFRFGGEQGQLADSKADEEYVTSPFINAKDQG